MNPQPVQLATATAAVVLNVIKFIPNRDHLLKVT
jgi:hypothetical protein